MDVALRCWAFPSPVLGLNPLPWVLTQPIYPLSSPAALWEVAPLCSQHPILTQEE